MHMYTIHGTIHAHVHLRCNMRKPKEDGGATCCNQPSISELDALVSTLVRVRIVT